MGPGTTGKAPAKPSSRARNRELAPEITLDLVTDLAPELAIEPTPGAGA